MTRNTQRKDFRGKTEHEKGTSLAEVMRCVVVVVVVVVVCCVVVCRHHHNRHNNNVCVLRAVSV